MTRTQKTPEVDMGVTECIGSDRYPYTVIVVVNHRKIVVRSDEFRRTDKNGFSEMQSYEYTPNLHGKEVTLTLRKNGRWVEEGVGLNDPPFWFIGEREAYQDPCF